MVARRRFLRGAAAAASVIASWGAGVGSVPARAATAPVNRVQLGFVGNPCEAATFVAPQSPIFRRNGLDARVVRFASESALLAALAAGGVQAASLNLPAVLRSLENGIDVRVVAGLHSGCLRVLARDAASSSSLADLRGQTIATDRGDGPSMRLLWALLRRDGIDPRHDVTWRVLETAALESAFDAQQVACVATSDPTGYALLTAHEAEQYLDSGNGGFSCGGDIALGHHCFLVLGGALVDSHPAVAASVTRAYLDTTAEFGRGVGPATLAAVRASTQASFDTTAQFGRGVGPHAPTEVRGPIPYDVYVILGMLSSYAWTAATDIVLAELAITARDFRRAGLLKPTTDPQELAQRAFADVLHA